MKPIFLDNNSTTTLHPDVLKKMFECHVLELVNPASQHQMGQKARRVLEASRRNIGSMLGARMSGMAADRVILTSGGTESNNLALFGLAGELSGNSPGNIIISNIEHPSIQQTAAELNRRGVELRYLPVTIDGVCDVRRLESLIDNDTRLVSVMLGNNETGVIQPIREIGDYCAQREIPVHTDAVQAVGKVPVNFENLNVTSMSFAAHKLHGPRGIGGLIIKSDVEFRPLMFGGFQQMGFRPGTEPIALTVGMEQAISLYQQDPQGITGQVQSLRDQFESRLNAEFSDVTINGAESPRLPHTSNISFLGVDRQEMMLALDMAGLCCSTGSSCSSGSSEPSPVLTSMGCKKEVVASAIRFGFSRFSTRDDIEEAFLRISLVLKTLRAKKTI